MDRFANLTEEERNMQKSMLAVLGNDSGETVVCFDGVYDGKINRWYKDVEVKFIPEAEKWTVLLDGKRILTRNNKPLFLPTEEAAMIVASDWDIQEGLLSYATMPMMLAAAKSIDEQRVWGEYFHEEIKDYLETDHLCYRDPDSKPIYQLQEKHFTPILEWFEATLGLKLNVTKGIMQNHPQITIDTMVVYFLSLDSQTFLQLQDLVGNTKSVVLAIALWHNRITVQETLELVRLEEHTQEAEHGSIGGAHDYHRALNEAAIAAGALSLEASGRLPPTKESLALLGDPVVVLEDLALEKLKKEKDMCVGMLAAVKKVEKQDRDSGEYDASLHDQVFSSTYTGYHGRIAAADEEIAKIMAKKASRIKTLNGEQPTPTHLE